MNISTIACIQLWLYQIRSRASEYRMCTCPAGEHMSINFIHEVTRLAQINNACLNTIVWMTFPHYLLSEESICSLEPESIANGWTLPPSHFSISFCQFWERQRRRIDRKTTSHKACQTHTHSTFTRLDGATTMALSITGVANSGERKRRVSQIETHSIAVL